MYSTVLETTFRTEHSVTAWGQEVWATRPSPLLTDLPRPPGWRQLPRSASSLGKGPAHMAPRSSHCTIVGISSAARGDVEECPICYSTQYCKWRLIHCLGCIQRQLTYMILFASRKTSVAPGGPRNEEIRAVLGCVIGPGSVKRIPAATERSHFGRLECPVS